MLNYLFKYLNQHKKISFILGIIWTVIIIIGCSLPGRDLPPIHVFKHFDKLVHFTFFMVFFILFYFGTNISNFKSLILITICFLFGFAIEFYQLNFVASRSFDVWDGVADTVGGILGYLFVRLVYKKI